MRVEISPGAVICATLTSTTVNGIRKVDVHGMGGPRTMLNAKKGAVEVLLPSATIVNVSPSDNYVAWDGEQYVVRPTLESILETDDLTLIGKIDNTKEWSPLHREIAAFTAIKSVIEGPVLRVPESLVRRALAKQYRCAPDEITRTQIMENLADLRDYYPRIEVTVPSSESSEPTTHIAGVDSMPRPKGKRKKLTPLEEKRRSIIFGALQSNLMGRQYCIHLDHKKLPIPIVWEAEGCPDTYAKAYTDGSGRWKKRIQDEKSRYNQKYRLMSAPAREKLIQQASRARGTR